MGHGNFRLAATGARVAGGLRLAFSLVELSIVLVILGLLTGGILAGQSLIRAAELRSVTSDITTYRSAMTTFRDKYFELPGDMRNATRFWGTAAACPGDETQPSSDPATCNGDGDGRIEQLITVTGNTSNEQFRAWQQLANAGLVSGTYSGVQETAGNPDDARIGLNVPKSRIANAGFSVLRMLNWSAYYGLPNDFNVLLFGAETVSNSTFNKALTPEEAWNLDTKLDDGKPAYGFVTSLDASSGTTPNCVTSAAANAAAFNLTVRTIECALIVKLGL